MAKDTVEGRKQLAHSLEQRRQGEEGDQFESVRGGWCLGGEALLKELLAQMSERMGAEHYGSERATTDVEKAERIIAAELQRRGWSECHLRQRPNQGEGGPAAARGDDPNGGMDGQTVAPRQPGLCEPFAVASTN